MMIDLNEEFVDFNEAMNSTKKEKGDLNGWRWDKGKGIRNLQLW